MNIGIIYVMQEEYRKALHYFFRADSVIQTNQVEELKYNIAVNLGDVYYRLNIYDTALIFFKKSLAIAEKNNDSNSIGTTFVGLGQVYFKQGDDSLSRMSLLNALAYLQTSNNEILICEAALSLAKVYQKINFKDSAEYYARLTFDLAKKDGFLSWELDAADFLSDHYKAFNKDSAFTYLEHAQILKDSLNSKYRILQSQKLATDEQFRQEKLAEVTLKQKEERSKQLQFLFIGIFIPGLLLFTVFLSRRKVHIRLIKLLGILSLLILFEYLTLLLHPRVLELTNHKPIYEIMVFVAIAALLIPSHHRLEHWLIQRLTKRKDRHNEMPTNIQSKEEG
jgi:predicted nucleic acid-binding Zn ribbon protein